MKKNSALKKIVKECTPLLYVIGALCVVMLITFFFVEVNFLSWLLFFVSLFFYFILPGYAILLHIGMTPLERIVFAIPISAAIITLTSYHLNVLFNIPLSSITVIVIIILSTIAFLIKKK